MAGIDSNTKLMLHMNGSDNGTSFTDDSEGNHTVTRYNAVTKTGIKQFGTASGYFDGNGDYLSIPAHDDFNLGTGDFTIDFWIRLNGLTTWQGIWGYGSGSAWWGGINLTSNLLSFQHRVSDAYVLEVYVNDAFSINTWYHVALVRSGSTIKFYRNGTDVTGAVSGNVNYSLSTLGSTTYFGSMVGGNNTKWLGGYVDEFRISKDIARWTENFDVPTEEYTSGSYHISGVTNVDPDGRVLIFKESDWLIESNTVISGTAFDIEVPDVSKRVVICRDTNGMVEGYGDVTPKYVV